MRALEGERRFGELLYQTRALLDVKTIVEHDRAYNHQHDNQRTSQRQSLPHTSACFRIDQVDQLAWAPSQRLLPNLLVLQQLPVSNRR